MFFPTDQINHSPFLSYINVMLSVSIDPGWLRGRQVAGYRALDEDDRLCALDRRAGPRSAASTP
jgi:hypothetical protein